MQQSAKGASAPASKEVAPPPPRPTCAGSRPSVRSAGFAASMPTNMRVGRPWICSPVQGGVEQRSAKEEQRSGKRGSPHHPASQTPPPIPRQRHPPAAAWRCLGSCRCRSSGCAPHHPSSLPPGRKESARGVGDTGGSGGGGKAGSAPIAVPSSRRTHALPSCIVLTLRPSRALQQPATTPQSHAAQPAPRRPHRFSRTHHNRLPPAPTSYTHLPPAPTSHPPSSSLAISQQLYPPAIPPPTPHQKLTVSSSLASSTQGPHHVAKKSMISGRSRFRISASSCSASTTTICSSWLERGGTESLAGTARGTRGTGGGVLRPALNPAPASLPPR